MLLKNCLSGSETISRGILNRLFPFTSYMDYREWDQVPDPNSVPSPERRNFDYTDIEGGERIGMGGHADVSRTTVGEITLVVKEPRFQGTVSRETYDAFVDEAETWAALDDHTHVVGVIDWGAEQVPWLAIEYMDGEDLHERIDSGEIETTEVLWIGICLSRAVQYAHRHGVAHLDLKPANVLFRATSDGVWDVPKIADWGLSSYLIEHSGTVEGLTPNYAAPEQFDADKYGPPDDFTDRYQLAALLYESLTSQQAVSGSGASVLQQVLNEPITPPTEIDPDLPDALDPIFDQALAKEKADRYETLVNFRRDLEDVFEIVVDKSKTVTNNTNEQHERQLNTSETDGSSEGSSQSSKVAGIANGAEDYTHDTWDKLREDDVAFDFRGDSTSDLVPGRFYRGVVDGYARFGVFIELTPGVTGLLHRSELDSSLENLDWEIGDDVFVQVKKIQDNGNIDLGYSVRQTDRLFRDVIIQDGERALSERTSRADTAEDLDEVEALVPPNFASTRKRPDLGNDADRVETVDESDDADMADDINKTVTDNQPVVSPLDRVPDFDFEDFDTNAEEVKALIERVTDGDEIPPKANAPTRLPVQDVFTISGHGTMPTGRVETGFIQCDDKISVQPSNVEGKVETIEINHEEVPKAEPGDSISFSVRGLNKDDIHRGDVCGPADVPPSVAETFTAQIVVIEHPSVITAGYTPVFHAHTAQVACTIESIDQKIDPSSGEAVEENPDFIDTGDAAVVTVRPQKPLSVEPFEEMPEMGTIVARDMGQTVAVGVVADITER